MLMHKIDMNFSGVYQRRDRLSETTIGLSDLPGTNGYLSDEARDTIRETLRPFPAEGIHFLDSGNYHYATLFWLEKVDQPYQLVVFDHHTDLQPSAWGDDLISCGSWIKTALEQDLRLQKVWLAGSREEAYLEGLKEKIQLLSEEDLSDPESAFCGLDAETLLYISVDKDVLSKEEVDTNWDQGELSADGLLNCLQYLVSHFDVIGVDVCGEPDPNAPDAEILKSEEIDRKIVSVLT